MSSKPTASTASTTSGVILRERLLRVIEQESSLQQSELGKTKGKMRRGSKYREQHSLEYPVVKSTSVGETELCGFNLAKRLSHAMFIYFTKCSSSSALFLISHSIAGL